MDSLYLEEEAVYASSSSLVRTENVNESVHNNIIWLEENREEVILSLGEEAGKIVRVGEASEEKIVTATGYNDILLAEGGPRISLQGRNGNDYYGIESLEAEGCYVIDQSEAGKNDRDTLNLLAYDSNTFSVTCLDGANLVLRNLVNAATITIKDWSKAPLKYIRFKDCRLNVAQLGYAIGQKDYTLKLKGEYNFKQSSEVTVSDSQLFNDSSKVELTLQGDNNFIQLGKGGRVTIKAGAGSIIEGKEDNTVELAGGNISSIDFGAGTNRLILSGGQVGKLNCEGELEIVLQGASYVLNNDSPYIPIVEKGNNILTVEDLELEALEGGSGNDRLILNSGYVGRLQGGAGADTYEMNCLQEGKSYVIDQSREQGSEDKEIGMDRLILNNYLYFDFEFSYDEAFNLVLTDQDKDITIRVEGWKDNPLGNISFQDQVVNLSDISKQLNYYPVLSPLEMIREFSQYIYGHKYSSEDMFNQAVKAASKGLYNDAKELIDSFIDDCLNHSGTSTEARRKFLKEYCGIDFYNEDTGAITGLDAGNGIVKNEVDIVKEPEGMTTADFVYNYTDKITTWDFFSQTDKEFTCATVNCNGRPLTLFWDEEQLKTLAATGVVNDVDVLYKLIAGVVEAWSGPCFDLVEESYGISLTAEDSKLRTLSNGNKGLQIQLDYAGGGKAPLFVDNLASSSIAALYSWRRYDNPNSNFSTVSCYEAMVINTYYYNEAMEDINGESVNYSSVAKYLDRVLAHELTHAAMAANYYSYRDLPDFLLEGLAELVHGADDIRSSEIWSLTSPSYKIYENGAPLSYEDSLRKIMNLENPSFMLGTTSYGAGYLLARYFAKQVADYRLSSLQATDTIASFENALPLEYHEDQVQLVPKKTGVIVSGRAQELLGKQTTDDVILIDKEDNNKTIYTGKGMDVVQVRAAEEVKIYHSGNGISGYEEQAVDALGVLQVMSGNSVSYFGNTATDIVRLEAQTGDNCVLKTYAGNDIFIVEGGSGHTLTGAQGNDRFSFGLLEEHGSYIIDQSGSLKEDRDILSLLEYDSEEFTVECTDGKNLLLKNIANGATIIINNWFNTPVKYIMFKDGRLSVDKLGYVAGENRYTLKLSGSYSFSGTNEVDAHHSTLFGNGKALTVSGNDNNIRINSGSLKLTEGSGNVITSNVEQGSITIASGTGNVINCQAASVVEIAGGTESKVHFGTGDNCLIISGGEVEDVTSEGELEILLRNGSFRLKAESPAIPILESGDNTLYIEGIKTEKIQGGAGKDILVLEDGRMNTLEGAAGDDLIVVKGGSVDCLRGGAGADQYSLDLLQADHTYVIDQSGMEKGDRLLEGDLLLLKNYNSKDFGFSLDEDHNLLMTLANQNTVIKVQGWADNPLSQIQFKDRVVTVKELAEQLRFNPVFSQQQVIRTFIETLDNFTGRGKDTFDTAIRACSNGLYDSAQELIDGFISDCMQNSGQSYDDRYAFLEEFCGINLNNADTGAISGYDAMGPVVKDKASVVKEKEGVTLETLVYDYPDKVVARDIFTGSDREFTCATVNCGGKPFTFYWDDAEFDVLVEKGMTTSREIPEKMLGAIIEGWAEPVFDLIHDSYGVYLTEAGSKEKILSNGNPGMRLVLDYVSYGNNSPFTVNNSVNNLGALYNVARTEKNEAGDYVTNVYQLLAINTYRYPAVGNIDGRPGGAASSAQYIDRVFAHEMVHATLSATIDNYSYLPSFLKEGLGELIQGVDDHRKYEILDVVNPNDSGSFYGDFADHEAYLRRIFSLEDLTYIAGTESYGASYTLLRYLAKQVADYSLEQASCLGTNNKELAQLQSSEVSFAELPRNNVELTCYVYEDKEAALPHLFGNI